MRTYARIAIHTSHTHAHTHGRTDACTHACTHAYTHARVLFTRMFADTFQDPTVSVGLFADLAGRQVGGHAHVQYVQTARGRTHARANARTHAHLHHVHVCARVTAQHEQNPTGTFQLGKNRLRAKRTPTGAASSGTPPPTLCGGTPGAFRRMAGLAATDDGSRSIAGVEWGVGAVLDRLHNNYNNATTGLPCPTPEWLQSAHHASLSTF